MTIGEQIRFVRKHLGLTQKELGQLSKTSERTIQQYEAGKRQPRIEQLQKIAYALGGSIYDIFGICCYRKADGYRNRGTAIRITIR